MVKPTAHQCALERRSRVVATTEEQHVASTTDVARCFLRLIETLQRDPERI